VGNDRLDLGDAVITEELLNLTHHGKTFFSACTHAQRPQTPRTARARTDCSSPAIRDAIARPPRSSCTGGRGMPPPARPVPPHRPSAPPPAGRCLVHAAN